MTCTSSLGDQSLSSWTKISIGSILALFIGFGVITEIRSAYQTVRKTDFGVYARAGWAVRTGHDLYSVTDDHGWHYCYPPSFAIAMVPFAEPPTGDSTQGYIPYAVSVGMWYAFSCFTVLYAVHVMASVILPHAMRGSQLWWIARLGPLWLCLGGIGMTLGRGQVNLLLIAIFAAAAAANIRDQRFRAGLWLGLATCIKVIPGLLFFVPLVRRDWRTLAGGIVAGVLLIGVLPVAVWGVRGAIDLNGKMIQQIISPGVHGAADDTRGEELTNATATDNQSFQYVIHNWRNPNEITRPKDYEPFSKYAHVILSGLMLAITLWGVLRMEPSRPQLLLIAYGCLSAMLPVVSPVSHMHYYAFAIPLVAGLWLNGLANGNNWPDRTTSIILVGWSLIILTSFLPIPFWKNLRPFGTCTAATLILWAYGVGVLFRSMIVKTKNAGSIPAFAASLRSAS